MSKIKKTPLDGLKLLESGNYEKGLEMVSSSLNSLLAMKTQLDICFDWLEIWV
jgi:hypothetical protein